VRLSACASLGVSGAIGACGNERAFLIVTTETMELHATVGSVGTCAAISFRIFHCATGCKPVVPSHASAPKPRPEKRREDVYLAGGVRSLRP